MRKTLISMNIEFMTALPKAAINFGCLFILGCVKEKC
jgi:hypothetical protein